MTTTTKAQPGGTPIFDELRDEFRAGQHDDAIAAEHAKREQPDAVEPAAESTPDGG